MTYYKFCLKCKKIFKNVKYLACHNAGILLITESRIVNQQLQKKTEHFVLIAQNKSRNLLSFFNKKRSNNCAALWTRPPFRIGC
jgi:hypothetical protein